MRDALVFGGSGQIGERLLARLAEHDWRVVAVSRQPQAPAARVRWLPGDLSGVAGLPSAVDAIFSCGPLDHFAHWYAASSVDAPRVIAFGSTSVSVKVDSADADERDLAQRLADGERTVLATAVARGANATLLRPTLVYGSGRDQALTRVATIARRWRCFALPRGADGLRQPVHVDDLVAAAVRAIDAPATFGATYDLPGGEVIPYRNMIMRVLAALERPAKLLELPIPVFNALVRTAQRFGHAGSFNEAVMRRLYNDLVFDAEPARRDMDYVARNFAPTAGMFHSR
ncbi:MAG: hypothetical protein JWL98_1985 [Xanthomonadaceae bacterium]|nr:hypothetical protein [Xanthomonadaceae bacterium]